MEDTLSGKFDLALCGITVTEARKEQALMSDGYLTNGKTILTRAEDAGLYELRNPEISGLRAKGFFARLFSKKRRY